MKTMTLLSKRTAEATYAQISKRLEQPGLQFADDLGLFRFLLEEIYREICHGISRGFPDTFSRMLFIAKVKQVPEVLDNEIHGLRKLLNDVIHNRPKIPRPVYLSAIKVLSETANFFSSVPVPASIIRHLKGHTLPLLKSNSQGPHVRSLILTGS